MRVLLAASEVAGFAKTGGLADVAGALPRALAKMGIDCQVVMPLFDSCLRTGRCEPTNLRCRVPVGPGDGIEVEFWRSTLPGSTVPIWFVSAGDLFNRDQPEFGRGLYQFAGTDGSRRDYPDNGARFALFSRAVLELPRMLDWWPDAIHANDWQTGLVPVYLREHLCNHPDQGIAGRARQISTLFTIHNIAYQGPFPPSMMEWARLDWRLYNPSQLEFYGQLNYLKAGVVFADQISTVSPTYAREIQTPWFGCGLQGVLLERADRLSGIVNGVDYDEWNPAVDGHLPARYDETTFEIHKPECKRALQARLGLPSLAERPVLGMIARLVEQKGFDILKPAAQAFLTQGAQLVVLGEGDSRHRQMLRVLAEQYPNQVGIYLGFDEKLAHLIEAGSDAYLMPSQYEPSGLNQLYSLKYGTPPIVRGTGGLADTVTDTNADTLANGTATGFVFQDYSADALREAGLRALDVWSRNHDQWNAIVRNGMRQDWSWSRSAASYVGLYRKIRPAH
jgi:starch synthase